MFLIGTLSVNAQQKDNETMPGVSLPHGEGFPYPGLKPPPPPPPRTPEEQKRDEERRKKAEEYEKAKQLIAK